MSKFSQPYANVRLSKALSKILRHMAEDKGLKIRSDGYVSLDSLINTLRSEKFRVNEQDIFDVVNNCKKKRFEITTEKHEILIRATQGHSIKSVKNEELFTPLQASDVSICIHGTYSRFAESIRLTGLNKMKRNSIHLSESIPGIDGVISGMRSSADSIVIVDIRAAIHAGIPFYRSSNNVVLSPGLGDTGVIPPTFIVDIVSREEYCNNQATNLENPSSKSAESGRLGEAADTTRSLEVIPPSSSSSSYYANPPKKNIPNSIYSNPGSSSSSSFASVSSSTTPLTTYYLCVLDFEATCWDGGKNKDVMEIIEFPSVLYRVREEYGQRAEVDFISEFSKYVKPTLNPVLSEFCTTLTGIEQSTVDAADTLDVVYAEHCNWLRQHWDQSSDCLFATCGDWDLKTHLPREAKLKGLKIDKKYRRFINVKDEYKTMYKKKAGSGSMPALLSALGLDLMGRHHSGIDDTRNIANAMLKMIDDGHMYINFTIKYANYYR